ncbi:MAG: glycosyltransferase [Flavobacteriaceae bacterium]|nr:glycosyltransferase [Flavobacteriaceae bacterium]
MIYLTFLIAVIYTILIILFIIGFDRIKLFKTDDSKPENTFTIIIPFRNEEMNLPSLLDSLLKIDYPKELFEIILINDDSTDNSVKIIKQFKSQVTIIENIRKSNSPKKDAIETAVQQSKFDWIVTTDADCIVPKKWLLIFDNFIQKNNSKMICAPVTYTVNSSFLEQFQLLDFMSLIGSTIGGFGIKKPFLCNGANLCYSKKAFYNVNGFEGNNNISSGDDIFLLEKMIASFPNDVHFLKSFDALILTKPQPTFKQLISQRVRWASKTSSYNNWLGKFIGTSVLLMNLLIIILLIFSILNIISFQVLLQTYIIKFLVDFILIFKMLNFTKQTRNIIFYSIIAIFYPFFIVFTSFLSVFKIRFIWKGRIFNS